MRVTSTLENIAQANEYNDCILRAFQEDQDIGNIGVLTELAGEIELDEKEFKEFLEIRRYETHQQALKHARAEIGIDSVPTFIIGDRIMSGLLSKDLERINAACSTAVTSGVMLIILC